MRSAVFVGAICALSVVGSVAQAQKPFSIGLSAGPAFPVADHREGHQMGGNASAHLAISTPASPIAFRAEGFYHSFAGKDVTFPNTPGPAAVNYRDARILGGAVNILYNFSRAGNRPYVIGGVGSYNVKYYNLDARTNVGFNAGAGAKFALGRLATFVEARLHSVSGGEPLRYIPITFGIEF